MIEELRKRMDALIQEDDITIVNTYIYVPSSNRSISIYEANLTAI